MGRARARQMDARAARMATASAPEPMRAPHAVAAASPCARMGREGGHAATHRVGAGAVQDVHQRAAALHVAQEAVAEAVALVGALQQAGHIWRAGEWDGRRGRAAVGAGAGLALPGAPLARLTSPRQPA
jgi:hypothetical protein